MQLKLIFTILISFLFTFNTFASDLLCTLTSDIDSSVAKLTYDMDPDTQSITHLYQEIYENNRMVSRDEMNIDKLTTGGLVLLEKGKVVVVRIWSDNFDKNQGGVLYIDTLYSGVSGERREYEIDLAKNKTGLVLSSNKKEFNKMQFIAKRSRVLGVIGIEKINFSK